MSWTRREFQRVLLASIGAGAFLEFGLPLEAQEAGAAVMVPLQPLASEVKRLLAALTLIGEPLAVTEQSAIERASANADEAAAVREIQATLDRQVLIEVDINPESRISVKRGAARAQLYEHGWKSFLVKVRNEAAVTSPLKIRSPEGLPMSRRSSLAIEGVHDFTNGAVDPVESRKRWLAVDTWDLPPLTPTLSGLLLEYRIVQIYSRDRGQREGSLRADAGFGEQDLGFRSTVAILFDCLPSAEVMLRLRDAEGSPVTASFLVTDALGRVYPVQSKRDVPDLAFERQIYRRDGETLRLPHGQYAIEAGRGPEHRRVRTMLAVDGRNTALPITVERWVHPARFGYFSGDTHIHAAGCSHYESPTEGVTPEVMLRQVEGEALDLGAILNWGPGFEYQKQFFRGHVEPQEHPPIAHEHGAMAMPEETRGALTRYDIEVSGFPSSHCGHLVLLRLAHQAYPGAASLEHWPSWNIPILKWAKAQGAIVGYAHSGHGLVVDSTELPNFVMPPFDSSGANEYIVDVTHEGTVDFISGCDLWPFAELNIWYHTLNCGFRTRFAGETDFPCITDECVGGGRSYVRIGAPPLGDEGYSRWVSALISEPSYVGDGRSHIFNFEAEGEGKRTGVDLALAAAGKVRVTAQVCARLEAEPTEAVRAIQKSSPYDKPYWHLERARLGSSRKVPVEMLLNGRTVGRTEIDADEQNHPVAFQIEVPHSGWIALRIYPSSHTNPIFISVAGKPTRASRKSAAWCRCAVDVCWAQKSPRIRDEEKAAAVEAFEHARRVYDRIVTESVTD